MSTIQKRGVRCKARTAPAKIKQFDRSGFMDWLAERGAVLMEPTNPYEVIRYRMWVKKDTSRPSTHIVYRRADDSLTYVGASLDHYREYIA